MTFIIGLSGGSVTVITELYDVYNRVSDGYVTVI